MKIFQSRFFEQKVKKLTRHEKRDLDEQVKSILENPGIGKEKKGDLRGVFIHKFKMGGALFLLAYRRVNDHLELIMLGPHENYYRNLKKYMKGR